MPELELVEYAFDAQYLDNNVGYLAQYIPQFSVTDSQPRNLSKNIEILAEDELSILNDYLAQHRLDQGRQFAELDPPSLLGVNVVARVMRFDADVVVGLFTFFSRSPLSLARIDWFIEFCAENVKLRKRSEALIHLNEMTNRFPKIGSRDFHQVIGQSISAAMRSAETIILVRNKKTLKGFETAYSSGGMYVDVPEGVPSAVALAVQSGSIIYNNDVLQVRQPSKSAAIPVHNLEFFQRHAYGSFIAFSVLSQDPLFGFTIFCCYCRPYAISFLERELFETLSLVIEGLYRRAVYSDGNNLSQEAEKLNKIMMQALLVADIMHDATEDLVFVRNILGNLKTRDEREEGYLISSRSILNEIIGAARSFKDSISDGLPTFQQRDRRQHKVNLKKLVDAIISKYDHTDEYRNVDFRNKIPSDLEINIVSLSIKRAIDNAIKNSLKHLEQVTHRRRQIDFSINRHPDEIDIIIYDNGSGMDEDQQRRCRELLYSSTKGMGFGMSIIEASAIAHRGRISIRSEPGKFCQLTITLECR